MSQHEPSVYALYDGQTLLAVGTAEQLAELLDCKKRRIYYYASTHARQKHADRISMPQAIKMFAEKNTEAMAEVCARICRHTRGLCRDSLVGCEGLGWCEPCYRGACKLVAERKRGNDE